MFVLYHYWKAAETYNAIRCFIAAYVWMTGFGNFSYFMKTNDFSFVRLLRMLFRLNFLVFFVCWVVNTVCEIWGLSIVAIRVVVCQKRRHWPHTAIKSTF